MPESEGVFLGEHPEAEEVAEERERAVRTFMGEGGLSVSRLDEGKVIEGPEKWRDANDVVHTTAEADRVVRVDFMPMDFASARREFRTEILLMAIEDLGAYIAAVERGDVVRPFLLRGETNREMAVAAERFGFRDIDRTMQERRELDRKLNALNEGVDSESEGGPVSEESVALFSEGGAYAWVFDTETDDLGMAMFSSEQYDQMEDMPRQERTRVLTALRELYMLPTERIERLFDVADDRAGEMRHMLQEYKLSLMESEDWKEEEAAVGDDVDPADMSRRIAVPYGVLKEKVEMMRTRRRASDGTTIVDRLRQRVERLGDDEDSTKLAA